MKSARHVQHNTKHQAGSTKEESGLLLFNSDLFIPVQFSLIELTLCSTVSHTVSQWASEAVTSNFTMRSENFSA